MITIHNFRAGFATNSSSSHSVVMIPDDMIGKIPERLEEHGGFGWDDFTLVSQEHKLRYLAAQLIGRRVDSRTVVEKLREKSGVHFEYDSEYVDHQSVATIPTELVEDPELLMKIFMSPNVVVLGGNDNSDGHPLSEQYPVEPLFDALSSNYDKFVRKDGPYFVIFNIDSGNKARVSYEDNVPPYTKASAPELVDLKITDFCDRGCAFCYQGSTKDGKHGNLNTIFEVIDSLKELEVFEVAIGGGEPTTHPNFKEIIERFGERYSNRRVVPNFTTMSDAWLKDEKLVDAVRRNVGAIGVSCMSAKNLDLVRTMRSSYIPRVMAQHVVGSVPLDVTGDFLNQAFSEGIPVLLLGFKEVGFGKDYTRHDHGDVPTFLRLAVEKHANKACLSVDTALVDRFPELPKALGAPDALVTSPEGKFSCYIDAVDCLMGPSSYVEKAAMSPLPKSANDIKKLFATY